MHSVNNLNDTFTLLKESTQTQKFLNSFLVGIVYQSHVNKISFLLFSLLSQDVTVISMFSLNFTRSGKSESFFGTGVSFNFWHFV